MLCFFKCSKSTALNTQQLMTVYNQSQCTECTNLYNVSIKKNVFKNYIRTAFVWYESTVSSPYT